MVQHSLLQCYTAKLISNTDCSKFSALFFMVFTGDDLAVSK